ncbi:LOW QUALITY PROTEIN: 40S small subunit processome assembly factor 1 [Aegotheles albertisi]
MGGAILGATGAAGDQTSFRPRPAAAMGARESCRRLEAVLGALYDLGEEPGARRAPGSSEASAAAESRGAQAAAESRGAQAAAAGGAGGAAGGRPRARDFFGELRAELGAAAPPPPAAPPAVEVVVFCGRKRKGRPSPAAAPAGGAQTKKVDEEKNLNEQEFNFEKARLEVHKFGITGYKKQEQRIWEQERAIMLGAKPPKKEHAKYKTYQEKMKEKKTAKDDDKGKEHKGGTLKKKKEQKERKAKRKKSVPSIWSAGQVGKFRDGTLILQSRDIKKIKSSKVMK